MDEETFRQGRPGGLLNECPHRVISKKLAWYPLQISRTRHGLGRLLRQRVMKPKLLVVELWGLGDLVLATPFLKAAAGQFEVTLLAKPLARELQPRLWPGVEVLPFTFPWTAFRAKYNLLRWRETHAFGLGGPCFPSKVFLSLL
jgi:hypothetical protein